MFGTHMPTGPNTLFSTCSMMLSRNLSLTFAARR
jgi:hypothetical protein